MFVRRGECLIWFTNTSRVFRTAHSTRSQPARSTRIRRSFVRHVVYGSFGAGLLRARSVWKPLRFARKKKQKTNKSHAADGMGRHVMDSKDMAAQRLREITARIWRILCIRLAIVLWILRSSPAFWKKSSDRTKTFESYRYLCIIMTSYRFLSRPILFVTEYRRYRFWYTYKYCILFENKFT